MATARHLEHAPIREAIIDVRIGPNVELSRVRYLADSLRKDFPHVEEMKRRLFGFEAVSGDLKTSAVDHGTVGFRLVSPDRTYVLQIGIEGFTFSRLPPYQDWEAMSATAHKYWARFCEELRPERATRVATRYINVMEFPLPLREFSEYLAAAPQIPTELPQGLSSFLTRVVMLNPETSSVAIVTQALEGPVGDKLPIVLDIDAFKELDEPVESDNVWNSIETLRHFKNRIFFACITDKTADLFS